jgi:putative ABC transport system permease protein
MSPVSLIRYAVRELAFHPARSLLAIAGVGVACAMLLDMLMLSSGLNASFAGLLSGAGYQLRVAPAGTLPLDTDAVIGGAERVRAALAAHPDVDGVAPVLAANLLAGSGAGERVFALGVDPEEQGLYRLIEGRGPETSNEVVIGEVTAERADLAVGDSLALRSVAGFGNVGRARRRLYRVVGIADFLYTSETETPVALTLAAVSELRDRPDAASFFMLRPAAAADPDALAAELRALVPAVEVASIGELVERAADRLSYFRQLAIILGTVSLVVTALLISTIMAVSINERYGRFAALRAIGISRRTLISGLSAESLILCLAAAVVGSGLGLVTAGQLERILADFPGLPQSIRFFVLQPRQLAVAASLLVVVGVGAALVPAYGVTRLPIAETLHREEP